LASRFYANRLLYLIWSASWPRLRGFANNGAPVNSAPHIGDGANDAMHILDYSLIGFLIAITLWAGAMALYGTR
jgi:hypothetical protein